MILIQATMTPTATEQREFWKQRFLEGRWRWVVFLALYFASGLSGSVLPGLFGAPSAYPGSNPPWYFIRQDFFQGLGHLIGILGVLAMVAVTWRRYPFTNWMLLGMAVVWMLPGIVTSGVIYARCTDLLDYDLAVSAWPTFEAYSRSGVKFVGIPAGFALGLMCIVPMASKRFRERHSFH